MNTIYDENKINMPYLTNTEAWEDLEGLLLFLLQALVAYDEMQDQGAKELFLFEIQEQADQIRGYIKKRVQRTYSSEIELPLLKGLDTVQCRSLERFVLIAGVIAANNQVLHQKLMLLEEAGITETPSKGLLVRLFSMMEQPKPADIPALIQPQGEFAMALQEKSNHQAKVWTKEVILIQKTFLSYLTTGHFGSMVNQPKTADFYPSYKSYEEMKQQISIIYGHWKETKHPTILYLYGEKGNGQVQMVFDFAKEQKKEVLFFSWQYAASLYETAQKQYFQDWFWQCRLTQKLPCLYEIEKRSGDDLSTAWKRFLYMLEQIQLPFFLIIGEEKTDFSPMQQYRFVSLEIKSLSLSEKVSVWEQIGRRFRLKAEVDAVGNGNKYVLPAEGISHVFKTAQLMTDTSAAIGNDEIENAVKQWSSGTLGEYATQIPCSFSWDDLILDDESKYIMRQVINHVKYRSTVGESWGFFKKSPYGTGNSVLFYGPPGTGKTMAAQVIAAELGLDLYRIDLSRMVSKYIGETEKNISALFEKAKKMNVILFFDEADSLFAKRSEVKDANDRNANAETAHLLQQLEAYEGLVLLATNLAEQIDDAFRRRIRFMIPFRFPNAATRKKLWHDLLPDKAPRSVSLDLDFFAEHFELSGSQIKEILVNGAFLAAAEGKEIDNEHIKTALQWNFSKYGKQLVKTDFGYL